MSNIDSYPDKNKLMPIIYIPHGGGPMPLLNEPGHKSLIDFLKNIHQDIPPPNAILMISAHWESRIASISSSEHPRMMYDYRGFPPECYTYKYPAPGNPILAKTVANLLGSHGIECHLDPLRGYDHGTFVPLMLMYPNADIPVVQLSLLQSLDPAKHIALGEAISALRRQGILIIGSGLSFHERTGTQESSIEFDDWLTQTLASSSIQETKNKLIHWESAPSARNCHMREDHLLPLHVCFGAAIDNGVAAEKVYSGMLFGKRIAGFLWR